MVRREEGEEFARLNGLKYFEMAAVGGTGGRAEEMGEGEARAGMATSINH